MLGAIAGDIIGVPWEVMGEKNYDFPLFTEFSRFSDDTVMSVAIAHALLEERDYAKAMRTIGQRYPSIGYGRSFEQWLFDESMGPYNSYGNGGAMRASPIGYVARSIEEALAEAERSAAPTHNHPEAIVCFLDASDFESAIRNAVSPGGDADTMACMSGAIAEAHWGAVPDLIAAETRKRLPTELIDVVERFRKQFVIAQ